MNLTLETVRYTLRPAFGRQSFIASFIVKTQPDERRSTTSIDAKGVMRYNPQFVDKYVTDPADLFCLIVHELMHPMFGHFVYARGRLENLGADMVINAVLSLLFADYSGSGALFRKLYGRTGLQGLLRPGSEMCQSRYARLYAAFYETERSNPKPSTGETIQALKVLTPVQGIPAVVLLGSHGKEGLYQGKRRTGTDGMVPAFSADALARIAQELKGAAQDPRATRAGHGENLFDFFLNVLKTHLTIKRTLLQEFATRQKVDRFKQLIHRSRLGVSPIPIRLSKRDFVLLAAGVPSFHYHNVAYRQATQERGLAVYLDVSGSVNQHLPEIVGLLRSLKAELMSIFLFSNKVVEVPFRTLLVGQVQTTYGTDFDCIAEHVLTNRFDKAVVLTDGYASMTEENQEQLRSREFRALTVLFGGRADSPEFEALGDVVQLDEVTV